MIPFHEPYINGSEISYVKDAINRRSLSGGGYFTQKSESFLKEFTNCVGDVLLTSSCTHALEMCALLLDLKQGDEIIMPSFTFVSSANAFVLRGAKIVFVDVRPDTMNIDERLIEAAITNKTKAVLVMHYGGVACEMDTIMAIAKNHQLKVVEDAAQCIDAWYKGKHLGTIGHFGTLSFHATKNIQCGEGGALLINDDEFSERAEIIREKGTNRKAFFNKKVDKYSWVDIGSSYLINEMTAAFLYAQLQNIKEVTKRRRTLFNYYHELLSNPQISDIYQSSKSDHLHNAHLFFMFVQENKRNDLINFLKEQGIKSAFHYVPLHLSKYGKKVSRFHGEDRYTTSKSNTLIRLPLFYDLEKKQIHSIVEALHLFHQSLS